MVDYKSKGCEHCHGVYGLEVLEGEFECPICGAKTLGHYRDFEKAGKEYLEGVDNGINA